MKKVSYNLYMNKDEGNRANFIAEEFVKVRNKRKVINLTYLSILLCLVSFSLSLINLFEKNTDLFIMSFGYAVVNFIHFLISLKLEIINKKKILMIEFSFLFWTSILFTFLFYTGAPGGFSAIWLLLYPVLFPFFLDEKLGNGYSFYILAMLIFFCWIPVGQDMLLYDYGNIFYERFPISYITFFIFGHIIQRIEKNTYSSLLSITQKYELLSKYDTLSNLYNRQVFKEKSKDLRFPCSLIMMDLDFFKNVNDFYGHLGGDVVISKFSKLIKSEFEEIGDCFRWGGEEFIIIINKPKSFEEIKDKCEQLRIKTSNKNFKYKNHNIKITTSIALIYSKGTNEVDYIIQELDRTLYKAKNLGRNRVESKILD